MENSKSGCVKRVKYLTTKNHLLLLNDSSNNNSASNANAEHRKGTSSNGLTSSAKEQPLTTKKAKCATGAGVGVVGGQRRVGPSEKVKVKFQGIGNTFCKLEPGKKVVTNTKLTATTKVRNSKIPDTKTFKIVKKRSSPDSKPAKSISKPKKTKAAAIQEYVFYDSDEDIANGPANSKARIAELQRTGTLISSKCTITVQDNLKILTTKSLPALFAQSKDKVNVKDKEKGKDKGSVSKSVKSTTTTSAPTKSAKHKLNTKGKKGKSEKSKPVKEKSVSRPPPKSKSKPSQKVAPSTPPSPPPPPPPSPPSVTSNDQSDTPPPSKKPRKIRKPTAEERIVDGFAFLAFKSYEDLTRAVATAEETLTPHDVVSCVQLVKGKTSKGKSPKHADKSAKTVKKIVKTKTTTATATVMNSEISTKDKNRPENDSNPAPDTNNKKKKTKKKVAKSGSSETASHGVVKKSSMKKQIPKADAATDGKDVEAKSAGQKPKKIPKKVKSKATNCKVSDGCTDLFAPLRKDSSPNQFVDNLHSPIEKGQAREREKETDALNHEVKSKTTTATASCSGGGCSSASNSPTAVAATASTADSVSEASSQLAQSPVSRSAATLNSLEAKKVAFVAAGEDADEEDADDSGHDSPSTTPKLHSNGPISLIAPAASPVNDVEPNGQHSDENDRSPEPPTTASTPPLKPTLPPKKDKSRTPKQPQQSKAKQVVKVTHHKLFTPYATTSVTTRATTPTTDSVVRTRHSPSDSSASLIRKFDLDCNSNSSSASSSTSGGGGLTYPGKEHHGTTDAATYINSITGQHPQPLSPLIFDKSIGPPPNILATFNSKAPPSQSSPPRSVGSSKSTGFESIARLLDHATSSRTHGSRRSPTLKSSSKSHRNNVNSSSGGVGSPNSGGGSASPSPSCRERERDNYSSASSLSRTSSVTPLNGGGGTSQQLPSNLSPLQDLSRSKAASWLSSAHRLSPVSRPTPPPASGPATPSSTPQGQGPHSIFGTSGPPGSMPPTPSSQHHSPMFPPPPMLPLSSMMGGHPPPQPGQPSPFGPSQSELVRRDLESRFLAERGVGVGAGCPPASFMPRPGELHPHHLLHMQSMNHLQGPNAVVPPPHSALFTPPYFKDMSKLGLDSPFYRASALGLPYPGFNGMLPPSNLTTPFTPPSQLPSFTPKKSGRWNAMHVRISWEIYQHQQKGTGGEGSKGTSGASTSTTSTKNSSSSKAASSTNSTAVANNSNNSSTCTSSSSSSTTDTTVARSNHSLSDHLHRTPPDPGFPSLLPPTHSHSHQPHFDPNSPLFLQSSPLLAPSLGRSFPPFGSLGPSFGGLGGIGHNILGRDISSLGALPPSHDQWLRMQRAAQFPNWPLMSREKLDDRPETKRGGSSSEFLDNKSGNRDRDHSPRDRSRSPHRTSRTSAENGDTTDSRSSSSNSANAKSSGHKNSREIREREDVMSDKDKGGGQFSHHNLINDKALPFIPSTYSSRIFNPSSPLPGWDGSFPGIAAPYRQSLVQLSERERELVRGVVPLPAARPSHPGNGPFMGLPLGPSAGAGAPPPPTRSSSAMGLGMGLGGSKGGCPSIPLLNPSMSIGALASFHSHQHSSSSSLNNGPPGGSNGSPPLRSKEEGR